MSSHIANDWKFGRKVFHYHPRSDEHSKYLCRMVFQDLLAACPLLTEHVARGLVAGSINTRFVFPNAKRKTLDLAIGEPAGPSSRESGELGVGLPVKNLRISCEAKQCMTEHNKSKPRIFDELSSSHEIVHQGDTNVIAAGIVVVNIAETYASPTRQVSSTGPLILTTHHQPHVAEGMVTHLQGLIMRNGPGEVGFDAFATIVIDCDNQGPCMLHTVPPAPQPGTSHHYGTFLDRISRAYASRYAE
ncbi:MAG: hypothetical protein JSV78_09440 [Phycisphaerales bacterium]|nr:MAG: hypothetical protein JSV78_09440 [Phycisphaerales bacterium]